LKYLSAATLKIDQSFIRDMLHDPDDLAIVEGVLGLATAFRRQAIAEGVETIEHGKMLLRLGCELGQGYGIARPMPAAEVNGWIANWRVDASWLGLEPIARNELPALFAVVDHNAWMLAIDRYIRGENDKPLPLNDRECRFGQWLHEEGRQHYLGSAPFEAIEPLHHRIHDRAQELVEILSRHGSTEASAGLTTLHHLSEEMLSQLDSLLREGAA
ncbi:MAG TPA: EAL domain-containing protein, partial [Halothiobacillus sp.]|nr:EAL domain-containing protein [Halothiobacillus sp.]